MSPENRKITSSPRVPEDIVEEVPPDLPPLENYVIYEGAARRQVNVWANYGAHRLEPVRVEDDWIRAGSGRNTLGQKVFVFERTILDDDGATTLRRQVLWSNFKHHEEHGKLYYFDTARTVDTTEIPVEEILARIEASYNEPNLAPASESVVQGVGMLAVSVASPLPNRITIPVDDTVAAEKTPAGPNYGQQLYFELAGSNLNISLTAYQRALFAPGAGPRIIIYDKTDLYELLGPCRDAEVKDRWEVTDQSVEDAEAMVMQSRTHDERIDTLFKNFTHEFEMDDERLSTYIRTDYRLRYRLAQYLVEKLDIHAKQQSGFELPYSNHETKRPNYGGYDERVVARDYTVLLALAKLDGTFNKRLESVLDYDEQGRVIDGKFRAAADTLLLSSVQVI